MGVQRCEALNWVPLKVRPGYTGTRLDVCLADFQNDKPLPWEKPNSWLSNKAAHFSSSPCLSVIYYTNHFFLPITHHTTHNQLPASCILCDILPAEALYRCLKPFFGTNHPLVFYTASQINSLPQSVRAYGWSVFRHICVCSVWISRFEESNVNAKWWGGRRL